MKNFDKLFERRSSKALIFIGALIAAWIILNIIRKAPIFYFDDYFSVLPLLLFFYEDLWVMVAIPLMWIVYTVIILVGVLSPSLRTSKILFFVFVFLLLLSLLTINLLALGVYLPLLG